MYYHGQDRNNELALLDSLQRKVLLILPKNHQERLPVCVQEADRLQRSLARSMASRRADVHDLHRTWKIDEDWTGLEQAAAARIPGPCVACLPTLEENHLPAISVDAKENAKYYSPMVSSRIGGTEMKLHIDNCSKIPASSRSSAPRLEAATVIKNAILAS